MRKATLAAAMVLAVSGAAQAADVHMAAAKPKTISLPGGFGALADPATGAFYSGRDIFEEEQFSFAAIFDTGASGNLISQDVAATFNLPTTGATFQDVGIGGVETFDVSMPLRLMLAPTSVGLEGADTPENYTAHGDYKVQIKQQDMEVMGMPIPFNLVGMPELSKHVMHVQPNVVGFESTLPLLDYMSTELLGALPAGLPAKGVFKVPLALQNFLDPSQGTPPVDTADNPTIPGVQVLDSRKGTAEQSAARAWLFDTGGSVTIIGRNYATEIGIDLDNEDPILDVTVAGVGGELRTLFGYKVDHLVVPLEFGDRLILDNFTVFVPEEGALPADLPGIFGVNNLMPSYTEEDPLLGVPLDMVDSPFSDWYFDPMGRRLVLVDPASDYVASPEPESLALLGMGAVGLLKRRRRTLERHGMGSLGWCLRR